MWEIRTNTAIIIWEVHMGYIHAWLLVKHYKEVHGNNYTVQEMGTFLDHQWDTIWNAYMYILQIYRHYTHLLHISYNFLHITHV